MKVLLSGYYGFGNAGDEALLDGLAGGLERRGHRPRVLTADPAATARLHGTHVAHRTRGLLPALLRCDALVSGGGGLLQDATSRRSLRYYLAIIHAARRLGKRVVVYGQSVGPLSVPGRAVVASALRGIPIAVRDAASQELLASMNLNAELVADPALLLAPAAKPAHAERPVVLIPRAGRPLLGDALAAVGTHFRRKGCAVEILELHPREDRSEGRRLAARVAGASLRPADDHREALERIASGAVVVSARLHGLILAAAARTPFVGLVYDPKVTGFLQSAGALGFDEPVEHSRLIDAAEAALPLDEPTRARLVARADAGLDWLSQTLEGRS